MGIFGCSKHHWDDGRKRQDFQLKELDAGMMKLEQKHVKRCQHDGCGAKQTQWKAVGSCSSQELKAVMKDAFK